MPHFTPNFKDPSSRGWGGITCIAWLGSVGWASFGFILLVSVLYNDRDLSSFLIGSAWLWLPLWLACGVHYLRRDIAWHRYGHLPPPCLVCDPQGLTIYSRWGGIRWQWRWQDIESVTTYGILHTLRITPRDGAPFDYRDSRLEREFGTYRAIAAVAQDWLHGTVPSVLPLPVVAVDYRCEDERYTAGRFICNSYFMMLGIWALLFLLTFLNPWQNYHGAPPFILILLYPLAVAIIGIACRALVIGLFGMYRDYFQAMMAIRLRIDQAGIHWRHRTLRWQDLRTVTAEMLSTRPINSYLVVTDRFDRTIWLPSDVTPDTSGYIATLATAIMHGTPLPPEPAASAAVPPEPRAKYFFCLNVAYWTAMCLFLPVAIAQRPVSGVDGILVTLFLLVLLLNICAGMLLRHTNLGN